MTFVLVCDKVIGSDDNEPLIHGFLVWDRDSDVHYFVIVEGFKDSVLSVRKMQLTSHLFQENFQHLLVFFNWQIRKTLSFFFAEHISHLVVEIGLFIFLLHFLPCLVEFSLLSIFVFGIVIQYEEICLRLESSY